MKTIALDEDAYEKLEQHKREGESFSDAVRRLTDDVSLREYYGVIDDGTADELEKGS
ncbi:MAG: antitoxin VapB family protein [Haloarculaceae archaeon]